MFSLTFPLFQYLVLIRVRSGFLFKYKWNIRSLLKRVRQLWKFTRVSTWQRQYIDNESTSKRLHFFPHWFLKFYLTINNLIHSKKESKRKKFFFFLHKKLKKHKKTEIPGLLDIDSVHNQYSDIAKPKRAHIVSWQTAQLSLKVFNNRLAISSSFEKNHGSRNGIFDPSPAAGYADYSITEKL